VRTIESRADAGEALLVRHDIGASRGRLRGGSRLHLSGLRRGAAAVTRRRRHCFLALLAAASWAREGPEGRRGFRSTALLQSAVFFQSEDLA
jgi:hypothetical protein